MMSQPPGPHQPPPQQPPWTWPAQPPAGPQPSQWPLQPAQPQQWGPGPQPGWPNPAPAVPPGPGLGTHLKRAFDWNLAAIVVTPKEQQQLAAAGVEPRLRGMLAWRRSVLITALPLLLLSAGLALYDSIDAGTGGLTELGKMCAYLPALALLVVPFGALRVITSWADMRRGARTLIVCWVVSIAVPLLVALIPLDALVDLDSPRQRVIEAGGDVGAFDEYVRGIHAAVAVSYAMTLLPVLITVPSGVLKGAARIKSLFPSAALPGMFLVAVAPFYSLFTIVVFVLVEQMAGNGVLLVGVGLLAFSPWLFVIYRKTYGRPLSMAEAATELPRASRFGGILLFGGLTFIAIFVVTAKVHGRRVIGSGDSAYFSYTDVLRALVEVVSRTMVTTVVFSAIVLSMVFAEWRTARSIRPEIQGEHDSQMRAIERYMTSPTAPQATWVTGPTS